ncbi:MAG: hypothetical protein H6719_21070 [Sandaracinaceae bacterium]|nr:hypothetical protein [Sandaracinaceae bacterium]
MSADAAVERDVRNIRRPVGAFLLVLLLLAVAGALMWRGWEFYALGLDARIDHDDFRVLSPGEVVGHGYGVIGTGLMFTNLLYLVRRKLARWPLGSMRFWLDLHVVTGLVGALLVVFHSAFQLRTPIAMVTSASLFVVVLTGVVGRYLYALSPQVDRVALETQIGALEGLVVGLGDRARERLAQNAPTDLGGNAGLIRALFTLPRWWGESRARRRELRALGDELPASVPADERVFVERAIEAVAALGAAEVRAVAAATLLRTWRGLHRFLAVLMLLSVSVHIGVAWFYGYRWLWSE